MAFSSFKGHQQPSADGWHGDILLRPDCVEGRLKASEDVP